MKFSLQSSFTRWVLVLIFAILASSVAGWLVTTTGASMYCQGFPLCVPENSLGWLKLTHILSVGASAILMLVVFRKAWMEQRDHRIVLPLTTILTVMFFGQALVGATQVVQGFPAHLVFLHQLTTISLWVSLLLLVYSSGVLVSENRNV
jgi:heme A synthase